MTLLTEHPRVVFPVPDTATAVPPPEARGEARDAVRLLVAGSDRTVDTTFATLPDHLRAGDVVVVNDSATVPGQLDAQLGGRGPVVLHVATRLDDGTRVVELRTAPDAARSVLDASAGDVLVAGAARLTLVAPYPLAAYQSVFATRPGSAEMPSAGRPFTPEVVTGLVAHGIGVVPVTLHTGVSSQEAGEAPQREWFAVSAATARAITAARAGGGRVVAVGTTVTRALESAVVGGEVTAASGWTDRVVTPVNPPQVVSGLVTGWHDPGASHLLLVEAVAGTDLAQRAYDAAVAGGYRWHEFGDSALLLP